jgi:hypothetical protein
MLKQANEAWRAGNRALLEGRPEDAVVAFESVA